ncbi:MAG: hypothetical protein FWD98_05045 [Defluviitaleaceae bacterium]|nr:hypothetical protein [Defluviitaleaceae bacterium]
MRPVDCEAPTAFFVSGDGGAHSDSDAEILESFIRLAMADDNNAQS